MGITIFASGKINHIDDISRLIDDLKEKAGDRNWKYQVIDDSFDVKADAVLTLPDERDSVAKIEGVLGLKGIVLNAGSGAEPLSILFDRSGALTDALQQISWIESSGCSERFTICKTQFADIESHIHTIQILDHLKKQYIADLMVNDEGAYWESRNRRILAEKRIALGHYLRHTEKVIKSIELSGEGDQDTDTIASRIEEALRKAAEEDGLHDQ